MDNYREFKFTRKQNNELIPTRKINIFQKVEANYKETGIVLNYYVNVLGKIWTIITLPIVLIFAGLSNIKEIKREFKGLMFQKKSGSYTSEYVGANSKLYENMEEIYLSQFKQN